MRSQPKSQIYRFVEVCIVVAVACVLLGKIFFSFRGSILFLITYGILVTAILWMSFIVAFFWYKDPYETAINAGRDPKDNDILVSCMVSVRNEEEHIERCVDSMLRQSYHNKEIIVVNDASTDGTLEILRRYEAEGKITLINLETNLGKKRALGRAMSVAKGEFFAHTDSDSVWATDAIERIMTIFAHDSLVGAVSGHGRAMNGDQNVLTKAQDAWMEGQFSIRKAFESTFNAVTCVSGPLAVFRKSAMYNFIPAWENDHFLGQPFRFATDRTMTGFVLGSKTIGNKLKQKYKDSSFVTEVDYPTQDWKVVYCKSAKSWTIVPDTARRMLKQQIRWKKSFIRNIFFTGAFYWRKPVPAASVYYFHILFVLMGPLISFRHLIYLPIRGDWLAGVLYVLGIIFVGFMFGIATKLEEPESHRWIYRPIMSLISTLIITWLIFYSAATIKKMTWSRT